MCTGLVEDLGTVVRADRRPRMEGSGPAPGPEGDALVLAPFIGKSVAGHRLEADPDRLDEIGRRGFLDWLSIYTIHS